jgi:hypothetical protein
VHWPELTDRSPEQALPAKASSTIKSAAAREIEEDRDILIAAIPRVGVVLATSEIRTFSAHALR